MAVDHEDALDLVHLAEGRVWHTRQLGKLLAAVADAQASLPAIPKNRKATVPTKKGGKFEYSYADLSDVAREREAAKIRGAAHVAATAEGTLVDWRNLTDGDEPVPFSVELATEFFLRDPDFLANIVALRFCLLSDDILGHPRIGTRVLSSNTRRQKTQRYRTGTGN